MELVASRATARANRGAWSPGTARADGRPRRRARPAPARLRPGHEEGQPAPGHDLRRPGRRQEPAGPASSWNGPGCSSPSHWSCAGRCLPYGDGVTYWPLARDPEGAGRRARPRTPPPRPWRRSGRSRARSWPRACRRTPARAADALALHRRPRGSRHDFAQHPATAGPPGAARGVALAVLGPGPRAPGHRDRRGHPLGRPGPARPARGAGRARGRTGPVPVPRPVPSSPSAGRDGAAGAATASGVSLEPLSRGGRPAAGRVPARRSRSSPSGSATASWTGPRATRSSSRRSSAS